MIKKVILPLFALVLLCLGIVSYVGYRSFNSEAFKEQIVQAVQDATGRTFTVKGDYKLTWDPLPTMTLEQVSLANSPSSSNPEMFQAEKIQVQIEWASLFTSPSRIKTIIIVKPNILIERLSRATNNLQFPVLLAPQDKLEDESALDETATQAQIDSIQIEDGTLHYINQVEKTDRVLSNINGTITMGNLSGPFSFEGNATCEELPLKIKASLGTHEVSQPVNFIANIDMPSAKAQATIDAQFHPGNTDIILLGSVSFEGEKPNVFLEGLKKPLLPSKYDTTTVGSMKIELNSSKASISDFIVKIGSDDDAVTVNANFTEGTIMEPGKLTLSINNIDLDIWQDTFKKIVGQIPLPNNALQFGVNIAQLKWHNQTASTLTLDGTTEKNTAYIHAGSILLPGSTTTQLSGRIFKQDTALGLIANIDVQSQNFPAMLKFFEPPQNALGQALQKIQQTEFKAALEWTEDTFNLELPALSINNATGVARFSKQPDQITDIVLELDNINLNDYLSSSDSHNQTLQEATDALFAQLQSATLPAYPLHAEVVLKNTIWRNTNFQNITLTTDFKQPTTNLEALITTQNQDSLVLKTDIQDLGTPNWTLLQNTFEINGKNMEELLQNLNLVTQNNLIRNAHQFNIIGGITGTPHNWKIETTAKTPSLTLDLMGTIIDDHPQPLNIRFQHKSIPHLFVELWDKNPLQNLGGELVVETTISQQNNMLVLSDLNIKAGTEYANGTANYDPQTHNWNLDLASNTLDLQKILPDVGRFYLTATGFDNNPFNFSFLNNFKGSLSLRANELIYQTTHLRNATVQTHLADNTLYIDNFVTSGDGETPSSFQVKGSFDWVKTPTFNIKAVTQLLPLTTPFAMFEGIGLTGGQLTSEWNLAASGETPLQMARSLNGNGKISLKDATWIGADLSALLNTLNNAPKQENAKELLASRFKHALTNGSTSIENIEGNFNIKDGLWQVVAATIETSVADSESATIDWDIPTSAIQAKIPLTLRKYATFPSLVLKFLKDKNGVSYTTDTSAFIAAVLEDISQQQALQQAAAEKAKKDEEAKKLEDKKQEAFNTFQSLTNQLTFWSTQLVSTPDIVIQKEVVNAQNFVKQLEPLMQTADLTTEQYQDIIVQTKKVISALDKAQDAFTKEQKELLQQQSTSLLHKAQNRISQINELYQKRPTLALLADILQGAEDQQAIMQRALEQYKKQLSFTQMKQLANIIQETYDKIEKAYDYAEGIYSGRQNASTNTSIRRQEP